MLSYIDDSVDVLVSSKVSQYSEHNQTGKHRGEGVADADDEGVPVAVVGELVVAGQGELAAVAH